MFRPSKTIFGSLLLWLGPLTSLVASEKVVSVHHLTNVTQAVPLASSSRRYEVHWRIQSYRLNAWADYVVRLESREFAVLQQGCSHNQTPPFTSRIHDYRRFRTYRSNNFVQHVHCNRDPSTPKLHLPTT